MYIAALFIITKGGNKPNVHQWMNEWINKLGNWDGYTHTHKMEYSAIKRNKVLIHVTTWINPENFMLSERRQSQKTTMLYYDSIYIKLQN